MGDLSRNFSRHEFRCKCGDCEPIEMSPLLIKEMQHLRDLFDAPITINSGHRCEVYNRKVGGAPNSQHLKGTANDFTVEGVPPSDVQRLLMNLHLTKYGVGRYNTFTHFDVRNYKARWDNRE